MGITELNRAAMWPVADDAERLGGWLLSVSFLKAVAKAAEAHGVDVSLEDTEAILLAAQAHGLLTPNAD